MYRPLAPLAHQLSAVTGRQSSRHSGNSDQPRRGSRFPFSTAAHTLLLSNELCHVALPKGCGFGATSLGFVLGLRKWVMIWTSCPKKL